MGKIKLEVGKTYELNNGEQHVCKFEWGNFYLGEYTYAVDGVMHFANEDYCLSVSHEVNPEPKTFGELTKEERGELLEHHWSGGQIQFSWARGKWLNAVKVPLKSDYIYRKAPTRVSGTVEINEQGEPMFDTWEVSE